MKRLHVYSDTHNTLLVEKEGQTIITITVAGRNVTLSLSDFNRVMNSIRQVIEEFKYMTDGDVTEDWRSEEGKQRDEDILRGYVK